MEQQLAPQVLVLIKHIAALAGKAGFSLYLVGGPVRDLFLERKIFDIDLVVEGDAILLARQISLEAGGNLRIHDRFGTATYFSDGISIDLVTARSEIYPRPGALPVVKKGSIADDMYRRDFTINAMAICLNPGRYGELIDLYHGQEDIKQRFVRIIHPLSFVDDATRILRALRYEQRLDFQLEDETKTALHNSLSYLGTISGDRIRRELELIMHEEKPGKCLQRAHELEVLKHIHAAFPWDKGMPARFERIRNETGGRAGVAHYYALLAYDMTECDNEQIIVFLKLPRSVAQIMRMTVSFKSHLAVLREPGLPWSKIYHLLHSYSPVSLLAGDVSADIPQVHDYIQLYLTRLQYVRTALRGTDLSELGVPPGHATGDILQRLKEARLDGMVKTKQEEIELVKQLIKRE